MEMCYWYSVLIVTVSELKGECLVTVKFSDDAVSASTTADCTAGLPSQCPQLFIKLKWNGHPLAKRIDAPRR